MPRIAAKENHNEATNHPCRADDGAEMEDKLRISVERSRNFVESRSVFDKKLMLETERIADHRDAGTARRWASLMVAAAIGRNME
jgi:hypothetical protein